MSDQIDLVWLGPTVPPPWSIGRVLRTEARPDAVAACVEGELGGSRAAAWLFWGARLGPPDPRQVEKALTRPGDLWHAGLRLGLGGQPRMLDYVAPTWMLNRDPELSTEATSWRLSLEACLVRTDVLHRTGWVRPEFQSLEGAALELGHRCITSGVLTRHLGWLVQGAQNLETAELPFEDELRFLYYRVGRLWSRWALLRAVLEGRQPISSFSVLRRIMQKARPATPPPLREGVPAPATGRPSLAGQVTVLIPTVDRYPYLEILLEQLRGQTVKPFEILVVDQTPAERRRAELAARFADLPLRVLYLDEAGQCSSRNAGLEASRGDFVLFLDDDDEIPSDLIERHLMALDRFGNDVSCGVAEEDGAGPLPEAFRLTRASDVFPTNNSLIRKGALRGSGLFDLAYDRGARADADLGMRLYLAGSLLILNPEVRVLHRHAPSGGLRTHGARVITYASSRRRLWHRHLPSRTELYLAKRYFSADQVREANWHRAMGTLRGSGGRAYRILKGVVSSALLPHTLWTIRKRSREADQMLRTFPRIPPYREPSGQRAAS